ncbi:MAG: hypothetical protein SFY66_05635 [Oculatellaceae cyanobacterium bins.114]|nr:hypothetical protein [Oculatellaceae cyanobacterium bins.114]
MSRSPAASISALLSYYSFDLGGYDIEQIVQGWLEEYPPKWAIAAVVEAIFQGRYKVASVDNILLNWYLNGRPQHHFDSEFADLVCSKLFKAIPADPTVAASITTASTTTASTTTASAVSNAASGQAFVTVLDIPLKAEPVAKSTRRESYSLNPVKPVSRGLNQGIQRWLRFTTKL